MKIEDNRKGSKAMICEDLDEGDVFVYGDDFWMKTSSYDHTGAVRLSDGYMTHMGYLTKVSPVKAKVVIE